MISEALTKLFDDESNCMLKYQKIDLQSYSQRRLIPRYIQQLLIFLNAIFDKSN